MINDKSVKEKMSCSPSTASKYKVIQQLNTSEFLKERELPPAQSDAVMLAWRIIIMCCMSDLFSFYTPTDMDFEIDRKGDSG